MSIPIFIGGCDRSGTTMLGSMLGAHTKCLCVPESQFIYDCLGEPSLSSAVDKLAAHPRFKLWNLHLRKEELCGLAEFSDLVYGVVQQYGQARGKGQFEFWADHTPTNIRYVATLLELFPQAKIVHLVRDGRAVAASIMPLLWGPRTVDKAAYFWLERLALGLAAEMKYGPSRVLRIKYEDLVTQPEQTLRSLCSFLGLEYQPNLASAKGFIVPQYTSAQHALVGQAPDGKRVHAWKQKLSERQIEIFENIVGDMLGYLEYETLFGLKSKPMTTPERVLSTLRLGEMFAGNLLGQVRLKYFATRNYL